MPLKRCKKCSRLKPRHHFRWIDEVSNKRGMRVRCKRCKNESRRHPPLWLPKARYWIRPHAVRRYIERVNPQLKYVEARTEMIQLMEEAPWVSDNDAPYWVYGDKKKTDIPKRSRGMLLINPATVFCLSTYHTHIEGFIWIKVSTVLVSHLTKAEGSVVSYTTRIRAQ